MEICFSNRSAGQGVKEITSKLKNLRFDDLKVAGGVSRYSCSLTKLLSEFKMMTPIDLFKLKNLLCEDTEGITPLHLWTSTILPQSKHCKCYLCGEEGHYARDCTKEKKNVKRVAVFENLSIPEEYDVMSVEPGDEDSDAIYSVSEGIDDTEQIGGGLTETIYMLREADNVYWLGKEEGYRAQVKVSPEIYHCQHEWDQQSPLPEDRRPECTTCRRDLSSYSKAFCNKCNALTCALCAKHYFNLTTFITRKAPIPYNQKPLLQEQQEYIRWCEAEMKRLREEAIQYKTELEELKLEIQLQKLAGYPTLPTLNFPLAYGTKVLLMLSHLAHSLTLRVLPNKELVDVNALTSFKALDIPCDLPNSENIDIKFNTIVPEAGARACDLTDQRIEHNDDYSHRGLSNMCDLVNQRMEHNDDCSHRGLSNRSLDISTIKSIMGSRNVLLLIATLLTTITYQVPFHVVGSASKVGYVHNYITGTFQLNKQYSLLSSTFMLFNSEVFIASVVMTLFLLHEFPFKPWPQISVLALFGSYMCLIKAISPNGTLALLVISIPFLLLVAARKIYGFASWNLMLSQKYAEQCMFNYFKISVTIDL
ncbi:unnamed protein product [Camellia sinensis]